MTDREKRMKVYTHGVERRLNLPGNVKARVMADFISAIAARRESGMTDEEIYRELGTPKQASAVLNEQMNEYTYRKSPWRFAFLAAAIYGAVELLGGIWGYLIYLWYRILAKGQVLGIGMSKVESASIGIIGGADGPTAILVSQVLKSKYVGAIAVAAYSYMALVPIVQPMAIKLVTTKKERCIHMEYKPDSVSKTMRIIFPVAVTIIVGLVAPQSVALVGFLMFGNLIRECGVLGTMSETAQNQLANLVTLLLGITISFSMRAEHFVRIETLMIMVIGLFAFVMDTIGGVCLAKFMNLFLKKKINPMVGGAGISAFPMSSRVVQKLALEEDPSNILIMHAAGANVSGQIASVVAGGLVINLVSQFL